MCKVLVVEDDSLLRNLLVAFVSNVSGIDNVDDVMSAEEALSLFEPGKYSLIVIDIALVEMNGVELALEIRKTDKEVILLAVSAYRDILDRFDLSLAGFNDWFIKPGGYKDFLKFIENNIKKT